MKITSFAKISLLSCLVLAACGGKSDKSSDKQPEADRKEALGAWKRRTSGVSANLSAVSMLADGTILAVGRGGTAVVSSDHGATWKPRDLGTKADLHSVRFVNDVVYVSGKDVILMSTDGGKSFQKAGAVTGEILAMAFSEARGERFFTAVGKGGLILRASLGEAALATLVPSKLKWTRIASGTDADLTGVDFSFERGLVVGLGGYFAETEDAGKKYVPVKAVTSTHDLYVVDGENVGGRNMFFGRQPISGAPAGSYSWFMKGGTEVPTVKALSCASWCMGVGATERGNSIFKLLEDGEKVEVEAFDIAMPLTGMTYHPKGYVVVGEGGLILTRGR